MENLADCFEGCGELKNTEKKINIFYSYIPSNKLNDISQND